MRYFWLKISFIIVLVSGNIIAQSYVFSTSHFARTIRLGNAYTGVAEGIETLFYNTAGIADHTAYGFLISQGQGAALFVEDPDAMDYAFIIPYSEQIGNFGFSLNTLSYGNSIGRTKNNNYNLSYARKLTDNLSAGINLNYYTLEHSITNSEFNYFGSNYNFSLSALMNLSKYLKISANDNFKAGVIFKNIFDSRVTPDPFGRKEEIIQDIRIGLSYNYIPINSREFNLLPLQFLVAFDAVFKGYGYDFTELQPNYGLELRLYEILELSFGRENEIQIKETYSFSFQHPVNRYGIGLNLPFHKVLDLAYPLKLKIDYSISDWQQLEEDKEFNFFGFYNVTIEKHALSVSLMLGF